MPRTFCIFAATITIEWGANEGQIWLNYLDKNNNDDSTEATAYIILYSIEKHNFPQHGISHLI